MEGWQAVPGDDTREQSLAEMDDEAYRSWATGVPASIIEWPLTDYRRYELAGWPMSAAVGTEYYLVDRDAHSDLVELIEDFWMYDEQRVAVMRYDEQERFVVAEDPTESIET